MTCCRAGPARQSERMSFRVLLRYGVDPRLPGTAIESACSGLRTEFAQRGIETASFVDEGQGEVLVLAMSVGEPLDPPWPAVDGMTLRSATPGREDAGEPGPAPFPVRHLRPRPDLPHPHPARWDRLVIRPDGRAQIELGLDDRAEVVRIVTDEVRSSIYVSVEASVAPGSFSPTGPTPALVDVDLPIRIVDGSRPAHRR
jgi:hypothetical protein